MTVLSPPQARHIFPLIKVKWLRFREHISFHRPSTFLILGMRGSGKSSLLEALAVRYPKIIDLFGSSDNEGLCWCKPEFIEAYKNAHNGKEPRILLVTGEAKDVASKFDTIRVKDLKLSTFEEYDIITTVHLFHSGEDEYFSTLYKIVQLLWEHRNYWTEAWFVLIREAANWIYARTKIAKDDKFAKAEFIKSLREARHHGLAVGVDTLRWTSLDKEIRDVSDFIFIKRVGAIGLPDDLRWMYKYIQPYSMMKAEPKVFMLTTGKGSVAFGKFEYPCWHKEEKENILRTTNIEVKLTTDATPDERRYGIGDFEHSDIIKKYMEKLSMREVASETSRSISTIHAHITRHNTAVERKGECPKCYHAKCEFSKDYIRIDKRK